jgi:hypothetical protein
MTAHEVSQVDGMFGAGGFLIPLEVYPQDGPKKRKSGSGSV